MKWFITSYLAITLIGCLIAVSMYTGLVISSNIHQEFSYAEARKELQVQEPAQKVTEPKRGYPGFGYEPYLGHSQKVA
jgi:hypothetical protein